MREAKAGGREWATRWLVNFENQRVDVWQEGEEICLDGGCDVGASLLASLFFFFRPNGSLIM